MDAGRPERGADARRERPAADLHEHAVGCLTGHVGVGISVISHPIVRPPSRHSAFSGPCTLNGIAPAVDRLAEAQHGRIARRVVGASLARW